MYVSGDLLIYYQEGDPGVSIAPDVFVVMGAAKHERPSYRLWDEPKAPDFVLEVASPNKVAACRAAEARVAELETLIRDRRG